MCARNHNGGNDRKHITNNDVSIDQFKSWFPESFLQKLDLFYASGNYGDPAFAKDCLEIYKYVRKANPSIQQNIHTNGSLRNSEWWTEFAEIIKPNGRIIFAVDGFKGKHELYRKNTDFDKIINNIKTVVSTGCAVKVNSLVFEHNQYDTELFEEYLRDLGVYEVEFRSTTRFYDMKSFPVYDKNGVREYDLLPATIPKYKVQSKFNLEKLLIKENRDILSENSVVNPKCMVNNEIYIDCRGNVFPCSYLGSDYVENGVEETSTINILRNISVRDSQQHLIRLGLINLYSVDIENVKFWDNLEQLWTGNNKCLTCVNICGNTKPLID
jgi:MoaA/NifB/PqqE/SkfB family radical SAM enzyme